MFFKWFKTRKQRAAVVDAVADRLVSAGIYVQLANSVEFIDHHSMLTVSMNFRDTDSLESTDVKAEFPTRKGTVIGCMVDPKTFKIIRPVYEDEQ